MGEVDVMVEVDKDIPCPLCVENKDTWNRRKLEKFGPCPVCRGTRKYHVHIDDYESTAEIERDYYAPVKEMDAPKNALDHIIVDPLKALGQGVERIGSHLFASPKEPTGFARTSHAYKECGACGRMVKQITFCGHKLEGCPHCKLYWEE